MFPLLLAATTTALGVLLHSAATMAPLRVPVALVGLVIGSVLLRAKDAGAPRALACIVLAAACLAASGAALRGLATHTRPPPGTEATSSKAVRLDGVAVESVGVGNERATIIEGALGGGALRTTTLVRGLHVPIGSRVRALVRTRDSPRTRNPSPHPEWPRAESPSRTELLTLLSAEPGARALPVEHARDSARDALERTLAPSHAALAVALVLGDTYALDRNDMEAVRGAGLAHVVAVSGMHVSLVLALLAALGRALFIRVSPFAARLDGERTVAACLVPLALVLAPFSGGSPSAWRAALTSAVVLALRAAGRRPSALRVTLFVVPVFVAASPGEATRPAFLLSVFATLAVLSDWPGEPSAPGREVSPDHGGSLWTVARLAARATVATIPISLWCFENVPWLGVLANVVALPVLGFLILPLAYLHAVLAVAPLPDAFASAFTGGLFAWLADAFLSTASFFADFPVAAPPPLTVPQGIGVFVASLSVLFLKGRARMTLCGFACAAVLSGEVWVRAAERPTGTVRVTFVDVGQGDGALVDMPDGSLMLVDTGADTEPPGEIQRPPTKVSTASRTRSPVVELLRARRRTHIDIAVITHGHPDHYGGLRAVMAHASIGELWTSSQALHESPTGDFARVVATLRRRGTRIVTEAELCRAPKRFGEARLVTLAPCPAFDPGLDLNDNSLVMSLRFRTRRVLFAGDIERMGEASLVTAGAELRAAVLKVPHHGSRTSSTASFLARVRADIAVISAGPGNRFGHPHQDVTARYRRLGTKLLRTDERGGCILDLGSARIVAECAVSEGDVE